MEKEQFKLAWLLVLNDYVDIKSKLSFGQTSKVYKDLANESFKQTKYLYSNEIPSKKLAKSLMLRCGLSLRTIKMDGWMLYSEDNTSVTEILAKQSPNLISLPSFILSLSFKF